MNIWTLRCSLAALIAIGAAPCLADEQSPAPMTTADFVIKCKAEHDWCVAEIKHHQELDLLMSTFGARRQVCAPKTLSYEDMPAMRRRQRALALLN
jgi:hypothetical protein